jgi:PAS domain S-box-containing protein
VDPVRSIPMPVSAGPAPARILLLAGSKGAADGFAAELRAADGSSELHWVDGEEHLRVALQQRWDAVVALWPFSTALQLLRDELRSLPLLLVADTIDDAALESSQRFGASLSRGSHDQLAAWVRHVGQLRAERLLRQEQTAFQVEEVQVLEQVAGGVPLPALLESVVRLIERHIDGICSILLVDRASGRIRHGAAPNLPPAYVHAIDGSLIGPKNGSCGAAAYRGERVIVRDIATHPYWVDYRHLALPSGLRACWSSPICSSTREVLGTFAVYHREPGSPTQRELELVDSATHLAAIAIMRERSALALRASERRYRQLVDTSHEGVLTIDLEGQITFSNPRAAEMLGYAADQLRGHNLSEFVHASERERIKALIERRAGVGNQYEVRMLTKSGRDLWTIIAASPIFDESDELVGALGMLTDISERRLAEEALSRSEVELRTIFEGAVLGIALVDAATRPIHCNPALERFLDYSAEELARTTLLALVHPEDLEATLEAKRALDQGRHKAFQIDARFTRKDGSVVCARVRASPIHITGRARATTVVMMEDVTESRRLEAAVRSEERLRALIYESVSDIIYYLAIEAEGVYRFVSVNPAFCVATGLSMSQVVGKLVDEVIAAESLALVRKQYRRAIQTRRTVRWQETSSYPSGTKYGEVSVTPVCDPNGACTNLIGTVHDITEHKQAEAKIAEQAALLDRARDAIVLRDLDQRVRFWNEGAVRLYGYAREEALGQHVTGLLYRDPSGFEYAQARLLADGAWTGELTQVTKTGKELVVESSWTLLRDAQGRPEAVLTINTDATEKKKLMAQLMLTQRMESLGTLAGGIAHDFNNILAAIMGYLELAANGLPAGSPAHSSLEVVRTAAERAADLVSQILTFSRRREPQRTLIKLQPVIEEALRLLRATLPAMVQIRASYEPEAFRVLAEASQIHQIVMNLGTNAAHAMGSHGTLQVRLEPVVLTEHIIGIAGEVRPGRYMRLSVSDDGSGMDAATLARIFDPFYTTKPPGIGTGLGLSVVLGIIKEHEGALTVSSSPGVGTNFELYFPEALEGTDAQARAPRIAARRGAGQCILCVDDEETILALETRVLEELGYRTRGYTDPRSAMRAFAENPGEFDAIVTDFAMTELSGCDLARAALRLRPTIPIIMTSGYLRPQEMEEAESLGVRAMLAKPDFLEALARTLAELFAPQSKDEARPD